MARNVSPIQQSDAAGPKLVVRSSDIHAAGCYTLQPIRKGERVLEYDGARIPKKVADARYAGRPVTYLFGFGEKGDVIDGFGTAMFINHSCAPNCETRHRRGRRAAIRVPPLRLRPGGRSRLLLRGGGMPRDDVLG